VRIIVGFPPGGGADAAARIAAARLSEIWGQQVIVENKGGAGGNIAHDTAAHAAPDGYTILFSPSSLPIMPLLYTSLNYDPIADFVPISTLGKYPNLIVVRTASKAYALAGLRVGFGLATREVIARLNPYRPPGSVSTVSVTLVTEALLDPAILDANLERVVRERARLSEALHDAGWSVGESVTNFILVDLGAPGRAATVAEGLLRRGLVPRTFGSGHPLAGFLRLTVRDAEENDRLIDAAQVLAAETAG